MRRSPELLVIALVLLAITCSSCAIGMRTQLPRHTAFCEGYHLVRPGEYAGRVRVVAQHADGTTVSRIFPMIAADTLCLVRPPTPIEPHFPDADKPEVPGV